MVQIDAKKIVVAYSGGLDTSVIIRWLKEQCDAEIVAWCAARRLTPNAVTAALVGLKSKLSTFKLQRQINEYTEEPLSAILPGAALQELWGLIGTAETALSAVSIMVVVTALLGMVTMVLATLNERRREMAILRSVGARPLHVFSLIVGESAMLTVAGVLAGVALLYGLLFFSQSLILSKFGFFIAISGLSTYELILMGIVCLAGLIIGILPGYQIYRYSLADGMTIRI